MISYSKRQKDITRKPLDGKYEAQHHQVNAQAIWTTVDFIPTILQSRKGLMPMDMLQRPFSSTQSANQFLPHFSSCIFCHFPVLCPEIVAGAGEILSCAFNQSSLCLHFPTPMTRPLPRNRWQRALAAQSTWVQISVSIHPTIGTADIIPHRNLWHAGGGSNTCVSISASLLWLLSSDERRK